MSADFLTSKSKMESEKSTYNNDSSEENKKKLVRCYNKLIKRCPTKEMAKEYFEEMVKLLGRDALDGYSYAIFIDNHIRNGGSYDLAEQLLDEMWAREDLEDRKEPAIIIIAIMIRFAPTVEKAEECFEMLDQKYGLLNSKYMNLTTYSCLVMVHLAKADGNLDRVEELIKEGEKRGFNMREHRVKLEKKRRRQPKLFRNQKTFRRQMPNNNLTPNI